MFRSLVFVVPNVTSLCVIAYAADQRSRCAPV